MCAPYVSFELCKLQAAAVEFDDVLPLGWRSMLVGKRWSLDCRCGFPLQILSASYRDVAGLSVLRTLQDLHLQTKLASPLLPDTSLDS